MTLQNFSAEYRHHQHRCDNDKADRQQFEGSNKKAGKKRKQTCIQKFLFSIFSVCRLGLHKILLIANRSIICCPGFGRIGRREKKLNKDSLKSISFV